LLSCFAPVGAFLGIRKSCGKRARHMEHGAQPVPQ
jgi:hypothetical protein